MTEPHFIYAGWKVYVSDDHSDLDVLKYTYFAIHEQTQVRHEIDISPYGIAPADLIKRVIDLGFPRRVGPSPLTPADIETIKQCRQALVRAAE